MADDQHATPSRTDYTVHKGEVSLAVYRKRLDPAAGPAAPPGSVPRSRLVEFGAVVVRPDGSRRRRILDDERVRRARLRRMDDGSRELRALVANLGQFRHRQRRRRSRRRNRAGDPRDRPEADAFHGRILGRVARRRLCDGAARAGRPARAERIHLHRPELADPGQARRAARLFPHPQPPAARSGDDPQHLYPRPSRERATPPSPRRWPMPSSSSAIRCRPEPTWT